MNIYSFPQIKGFDRLIKSLPENEKQELFEDMSNLDVSETDDLASDINKPKTMVITDTDEARKTFVIALKALSKNLISIKQMATLHIVDAAVRDLMTYMTQFLAYEYIEDQELKRTILYCDLCQDQQNAIRKDYNYLEYTSCMIPDGYQPNQLKEKYRRPILQRFFNCDDKEWASFCDKMKKKPLSERFFYLFNLPKFGCWSGLAFKVQQILKICRPVKVRLQEESGLTPFNKMPVPSFSMFQVALKVKAETLGRKPVKLIPTYGLLEATDYAETKEEVGIPLALYFPEKEVTKRYSPSNSSFKAMIDGFFHEGPFAALLHDFYHALREMAMTENIAKARFHMAKIAKAHPFNKLTPDSRLEISDILIDGELLFCYPREIDTIFKRRSRETEKFSSFFSVINKELHPELKKAFIHDMVVKRRFWKEEFGLGRCDLKPKDRILYDECLSEHIKKHLDPSRSKTNGPAWRLLAAAEKDDDAFEAILKTGISVDDHTEKTDRALFYAIKSGNIEATERLLKYKASSTELFISNETPILVAAEQGHFYTVQLLLKAGADVNSQNVQGQTVLHLAIKQEKFKIIEIIVKQKGIQLDMTDEDGNTPLGLACSQGLLEVARFLINTGASIDIKNHKGQTPIDIAKAKGCIQIVELFEKHAT